MVLDSLQFKAMESGIKAMSLKQQVHTQNIANMDTPDYKMKTFSFENSMENAMAEKRSGTTGEKGKDKYSFEAVIGQRENTATMVDGNNVDAESENLELYSAYVQHSAIIQKMNSVISDYRYVLTNSTFK